MAEIEEMKAALESFPSHDGPEKAAALNELAKAQWRTALQENDGHLLQEAIATIQQAVTMSETLPDKQAAYLNNLGIFLTDLATMSKNATALEQSVQALERGIRCAPDHLKCTLLLNLANTLRTRYGSRSPGDINDLHLAISTYRRGLGANPTPSNKPKLLNGLGGSLLDRSKALHSLDDLKEACDTARKAIEESDDNHPFRAVFLDTYAYVLAGLFDFQPSMGILDASISWAQQAITIAKEKGSHKLPLFVGNLASSLLRRHRINGSVPDLEDAIGMLETILQTIVSSDPAWQLCSLSYSLALQYRFERSGAHEDIESCVENLEELRVQVTEQDPFWPRIQSAFADALILRSEVDAAVGDLDTAVQILKDAADHLSNNTLDASTVYGNLSVALLARFELRGSMDDLDLSRNTAERALDLLSPESIDYTIALATCASAFQRSFEETDDDAFLDAAIDFYEEAVTRETVWTRLRPGRLIALGFSLQLRYGRHKRESDWAKCYTVCKEAVDLSVNSPTIYLALGQQGGAFLEKARVESDTSKRGIQLHQAISSLDQSLNMMPAHHIYRAPWLNNLGLAYEMLYKDSGDQEAYMRGLACYVEAAELSTAAPFQRVTAVYRALVLAGRSDIHISSKLARLAIRLMPTLSPRLLKRQDQSSMISMFSGLGSYCTAILLEAGHDVVGAVNALEASRGVMSSLLIDTRTDLTALQERDESLAEQFADLCSKLDSKSDRPSQLAHGGEPFDMTSESRIVAAKAFDKIVAKIRELDGFHNFLQPPNATGYQAVAASSHIVFLNVASFRCDALVISSGRIWNIPLEKLNQEDAVKKANTLMDAIRHDKPETRTSTNDHIRELLSWLWATVVNPIQSELQPTRGETKIRVCWIPTGVMTNFPIHAAADEVSGDNAMDTIISSYGTTIKAITFSQQKLARLSGHKGQALLVSMKETPGEAGLPLAEEEAKSLLSLLHPLMPVTMFSNPPLQSNMTTPTKPRIIEGLETAAIALFSCHGVSDYHEPSSSRLLLSDWQSEPLTVADITAQRLPCARTAWLSACHAAVGRAPELLDEGIHLAAAFQLAGFPQVVGTLWQANDRRAMEVSRRVWEILIVKDGKLNFELMGEAVNTAVRELRESTKMSEYEDIDMEFDDEPFLWAPFVYIGL
ncbi:TPR domain protein [Fusarium beomiforme]|uniref:TPR domain protein n=1 Tax=Fusarium beomiforme TaxID=44412 RepID=A0A9P5DWH2_9HYPO|nr:TPR domain protein [Fusarium beomiforme]